MHKLKDLCHIEKGATGIMKAVPGKYPMVGIAEERRTHTSYQFDAAAVIIPLVSSTGHGHASLKRIHYQEGKFALGSILCALVPKDPTELDPLYLYHYLDVYKEKLFVPLMRGMANVSLSMTSIGEVEVPVPTKAEQDEWVQKFEWVNEQQEALTTELDHQRALLKQLRQAILQEAVQGKLSAAWRTKGVKMVSIASPQLEALRKQVQEGQALARGLKSFKYKPSARIDLGGKTKGIENLNALPEGWQWVSLGQICWSVSDGPHFSPRYVLDGVHMVSGRNITLERGIDFDTAKYVSRQDYLEFIKRGKPDVGDVLLTKGGTTGVPAVVERDEEFCVWVHVAIIKLLREVVDPYYLKWALASPQVYRQSQEQTHGIGNQDLGLTRMVYFAIPLPPIVEQREIARMVAQLMKRTVELEDSLDAPGLVATTLLQSVLSEAMGGPRLYATHGPALSMAAEK